MPQILQNKTAIEQNIAKAAEEAGRKPEEIKLVAVSKKQPAERVLAALEAGHRIYGENRVQEALARWEAHVETYPDLELRLIGPLQTNKVRDAVRLFDSIESVDRPKLAEALAKEMVKQDKYPSCYVQVNTGEEEQKSGVHPEHLPDLLAHCAQCGLKISGLMCIPPQDEPSQLHFALLKKLAARHNLPELSMGMSHDYEAAVRLGATSVRVGTAFFGARDIYSALNN